MPEIDVPALTRTVLACTFALTFLFGAVLQRTHFCTMGAVSDIVNMGDWTRMRMWVLAIGVAMIGTGVLAWSGQIDPARTIYAADKLTWLSALVGGLLFGFGMVLASGCGSKTLVRIGAGNLKSLVVFVFLGLSAYMTLRGLFGVIRVNTVDAVAMQLPTSQDLPSLLAQTGLSRGTLQLVLGLLLGGVLSLWALAGKGFRTFDNLLGGIAVGLIIVAMWYVSGHLGFVPEDPDTLEEVFVATNSGRMESLSFVAPYAYTLDWLMMFSDKSKVLTVGIVSVIGVIAGAAAYALASRTFRWEGFGNAEDVANHIVGGILMGAGGVTALGCTIGQGLSGVSTLAIGSFIALAGILLGAVLAFRYQMWRLERMV
ncbi:putative yeeE-like protein [Cupriavidus gilardii CR3]|uniref:YeeE/YedE family protein n=1 Tax=Cupriavidus gilardii TaxID=82541 RepID=A0A6N1BDV0_9BURK|nr:YeeE/YedE family protein [Cupriavidus gilardii]ALD89819.1 putative yeeE-like protein [Cupriavidus gilardii CR3]QQE07404.1 YeeE/YedE family protein [Cupriavidus sp. ISTL7]KAB0598802.1 YeeE/YedE family protein [Cupriavidus gilardii]MCT9015328.1 YeeE/YedE family protein [Cupriavidus gilardii]MCT9055098.1 YeeE/YedE family protein [Cupriavidus gilardii]